MCFFGDRVEGLGLPAAFGKSRPVVPLVNDDPREGKVLAASVADESIEVITALAPSRSTTKTSSAKSLGSWPTARPSACLPAPA